MLLYGQSMLLYGQSMLLCGQSMLLNGQSMLLYGQSILLSKSSLFTQAEPGDRAVSRDSLQRQVRAGEEGDQEVLRRDCAGHGQDLLRWVV